MIVTPDIPFHFIYSTESTQCGLLGKTTQDSTALSTAGPTMNNLRVVQQHVSGGVECHLSVCRPAKHTGTHNMARQKSEVHLTNQKRQPSALSPWQLPPRVHDPGIGKCAISRERTHQSLCRSHHSLTLQRQSNSPVLSEPQHGYATRANYSGLLQSLSQMPRVPALFHHA